MEGGRRWPSYLSEGKFLGPEKAQQRNSPVGMHATHSDHSPPWIRPPDEEDEDVGGSAGDLG